MLLTKTNIVKEINNLLVSYKVKWEDIVLDLDMAIDEINSYMSTRYPSVSSILTDNSDPDKTYSYRAGGYDLSFFPDKYFFSIVIPYVATQILTKDEEFTTVYTKYERRYQENLFVMARDEMSNIPYHLIAAPKGVYFANPDPLFKYDAEAYFNKKIQVPVPRIRVTYSWGTLEHGFVARPLPVDPNAYDAGYIYAPVIMQTNEFLTMIVDTNQNVIGTFVGWSFAKEGEQREIINEPFELTEDVTLYAVFNYDLIVFKYNGNGGSLNNWRPLYIDRKSVTGDVFPQGGTASRRGYSFIGFNPIKVNQETIQLNSQITFDDGFDQAELDLINITETTPTIEFTAQWSRVLYKIGFNSPTFQGRSGYIYGEEFDLALPNNQEGFIGWWDNPSFSGDPVTKIYESDYGDKYFYAKYNLEAFLIIWKDLEGNIIRQESIAKGHFIPEGPEITKQPSYDENGLLFEYDFDGYFDEDGKKWDNQTTATKRQIFTASFFPKPVEATIRINYISDTSTPAYEITKINIDGIQVGRTINFEEIISYMSEFDLHKYTSGLDTYYTRGFSSSEDPLDEISGTGIQISSEGNIDVYALYESQDINLTIYKRTFDPDGPIFQTIETIKVRRGIHRNDIKFHLPFALTDIASKIPVRKIVSADQFGEVYFGLASTDGTLYLESFSRYTTSALDVAITSDTLEEDTHIVPNYSTQVNFNFSREFRINYLPNNILGGYTTVIEEKALNEIVNVTGLITYYSNSPDHNKYKTVTGFVYLNGTVASATIKMVSNVSLYPVTTDNPYWNLIYKYGDGLLLEYIARRIYPFELEGNGLTILTNSFNVPSFTYEGFLQDGWSRNEGSQEKEVSFTLTSLVQNVILYPVLFAKAGFKINTNVVFNRTESFPTIINKNIDQKNYSWQLEGTTQVIFSNKISTFSLIEKQNLMTSLFFPFDQVLNYQMRGYELKEYMTPQQNWDETWDIFLSFGASQSTQQTFEIKLSLIRNNYYWLVTIDTSLNPLEVFVNPPEEKDKKMFIEKNRTFGDYKTILPQLSPGYIYARTNGNLITDATALTTDLTLMVIENPFQF